MTIGTSFHWNKISILLGIVVTVSRICNSVKVTSFGGSFVVYWIRAVVCERGYEIVFNCQID
jgi:hypothetical protein